MSKSIPSETSRGTLVAVGALGSLWQRLVADLGSDPAELRLATDAATGTLTFAPGGPLSQDVAVTVIGDDVSEADETVRLTLSGATGGPIGGTNPACGEHHKCVEGKCGNWQNQACALIDRMREQVDRLQPSLAPVDKLKPCAIRTACVWWRQTGPDACRVCPFVIYNPSE